jgi:hypothetical protein
MAQYTVKRMRAIFPKGKVAERNPDRFVTIYGQFHNEKGEKLSIGSKAIDKATALSPDFALDVANGTLTLPDGQRGRQASVGVSQTDVEAALAALRKPSTESSGKATK